MNLEGLVKHLGSRYAESKLVPATTMCSTESREYRLHSLSAASFNNYSPESVTEPFRVLAVDGGSVSLFDTPYWGIGLLKLKARLVELDPRTKRGDTIREDSQERFVLFTEDGADGEDIVSREFYDKGNYLKREETRFIRDKVSEGWLSPEDIVLVDGALSMQTAYEKEIIRSHSNVIGVSKRSGLRIGPYSAASYLLLKATEYGRSAKPWFCHPLVAKYPGDAPTAEIVFASFTPNARYAFRVDFPFAITELNPSEQTALIADRLSKLSLFSRDPKYKGYPYPLGAVHTDSVTRPIDKDRARVFVQQKVLALPEGRARELIMKDIENEYWYDKFRQGGNK